jgi:hypothetical protein
MYRMSHRPGDRSPGFFIEPSRCWALVYDHNRQMVTREKSPDIEGDTGGEADNEELGWGGRDVGTSSVDWSVGLEDVTPYPDSEKISLFVIDPDDVAHKPTALQFVRSDVPLMSYRERFHYGRRSMGPGTNGLSTPASRLLNRSCDRRSW